MNGDNGNYVLWWWQRGEHEEQRGDFQASSCYEIPGADLLQDDASEAALMRSPLGEPPTDFTVRSVYDVRPVNGYDFNYFKSATITLSSGAWMVTFNVPPGYRAVVRHYEVEFDACFGPGGGVFAPSGSTASLQQNGANVPNNQTLDAGFGAAFDCFYLCEENTTFGLAGINLLINSALGGVSTANVSVYGNLIAVDENALPLSIANKSRGV
jgi:hypothetical protein